MNLENFNPVKINTILVYDNMDISNVSFDKIKNDFKNEVNLHQVAENVLVVVFKNEPIQAQIGQRRLVVNYDSSNQKASKDVFDKIVSLVIELKKAISDSKLIAYGFNYDFETNLKKEDVTAGEYLTNKFLSNQQEIETISQGEITEFEPNFSIDCGEVEYNISIKAENNSNKLGIHVNAHFDDKDNISKKALTNSIDSKYNEVIEMLKKW